MTTATTRAEPRDFDDHGISTLEAISRAEIDVQIETAKKYPRSVEQFKRDATTLATWDEQTAKDCMYALPRGGKTIKGASIRMAEILLTSWGNAQAGSRIIDEDGSFIVAQGVFRDMERNTAITREVRRRITDKSGNRYNDDMITTTANAASSIAMRNAILAGIPRALWNDIYAKAQQIVIGDAATMAQRRDDMVAHFQKFGVGVELILAKYNAKGLEDIGQDEMVELVGIANAIRDGDATIDDAFPPPAPPEPPSTTIKTGKKKNGDPTPEENAAKIEEARQRAAQNAATDGDAVTPAGDGASDAGGAEPSEGAGDPSKVPAPAATSKEVMDAAKKINTKPKRWDWLTAQAMREHDAADAETIVGGWLASHGWKQADLSSSQFWNELIYPAAVEADWAGMKP